jgi:hypothetical protein
LKRQQMHGTRRQLPHAFSTVHQIFQTIDGRAGAP